MVSGLLITLSLVLCCDVLLDVHNTRVSVDLYFLFLIYLLHY